MEISVSPDLPQQLEADALVVGVFDGAGLAGPAAAIDQASGGVLRRLVEAKEISGKLYELTPIWTAPNVAAPLVLVVGLGEQAKFDRGLAFRGAAAASRYLAAKPRRRAAFALADGLSEAVLESAVAGAVVGCQGQDLYRAEKNRNPFESLVWLGADEQAVRAGQILGESVNLTRRLVDEPPQQIYPESFCDRAAEMARQTGLEIEIWDEARLQRERAGALLAVARGSTRPPRLLILRHSGGAAGAAPLALVGKGVTFDSGGLSLKPNDSMKTMKCDMAGAAAVLGAMRAIALLKLPVNAIGLAGLVENMPSGSAMKLGDVLAARNGRTIEVQNTDAEGRLVLADVLDVAVERGAARIVDLATLTGACVVALGTDVAALMSNDQPWCDRVAGAASTAGEPLWQLPMFAEYREGIKSEVADIRNTGEGRWGGAISAAKFLEEFVGGTPWAHLDIAGPAFLEKSKPWSDSGASGAFVRTLVELARAEAASGNR
ncbi:MAG TPA: leucyl aminopeptidase [Pirellulales bacterium]|nr:leucyl aminopeptidase [Pirellulales bacterium]